MCHLKFCYDNVLHYYYVYSLEIFVPDTLPDEETDVKHELIYFFSLHMQIRFIQ